MKKITEPLVWPLDRDHRQDTGARQSYRACVISCKEAQNMDADYTVNFKKGDKSCSVKLRVILISKVFGGFKSNIKQKTSVTCL